MRLTRRGALKELPGVSTVVVNLAANIANLSYDPQRVKVDDMLGATKYFTLAMVVPGMSDRKLLSRICEASKGRNGSNSEAAAILNRK